MRSIRGFWNDLSIAHKLNFVIGVMAFLIVGELLTLRFAMSKLSAARALVSGESLWSKAQKNAILSLQRYELTHDEKDFKDFLAYLQIPEGDHHAREEMSKKNFNYEVVKKGFMQGQIHEDDIPAIVDLLRKFYWISYLDRSIQAWAKADTFLDQVKEQSFNYHQAIVERRFTQAKSILSEIKNLNEQLTVVETEFSDSLGEGSRWLEHVILFLLTLAVLTVESIGISLAFFTNRSISHRLAALQNLAQEISRGNFSRRIEIDSKDEIGQLMVSVNQMGATLETSYHDLERRVTERTAEATAAVQMRDEFLSIASHELRTPLTSLSLELQLLARKIEKLEISEEKTQALSLSERSTKAVKRLTLLLDELLDLTRIQVGKFEVHPIKTDLIPILHDCVSKFGLEASHQGSTISIRSPSRLSAVCDPIRIEQVVTNLISNALKYGGNGPIEVIANAQGNEITIAVKDHGPGIPLDKQDILFERFERVEAPTNIKGLGLGLYISKQIMDAHQGSLTVKSEPGAGATFTMTLTTDPRSS